MDTSWEVEIGWKAQERGILDVMELLRCIKILYRMNKLSGSFWVGVRGETDKGDIVVGDKGPVKVPLLTFITLAFPGRGPQKHTESQNVRGWKGPLWVI